MQAASEHRMREVRLRLGHRLDGIPLRHVAVPQPLDLREYEPHPVRALFSRPQLGDHAGPDGLLGLQETVEDVGEGHGKLACAGRWVDGGGEMFVEQVLSDDG